MNFFQPLRVGERLGALALLLLLLAVLTGVSLTQAGLLDDGADTLDEQALPTLQRLHGLRQLVNDARGMEALHLLTPDAAQRGQLEQQMRLQRELVQQQLQAQSRRAPDPADEGLQAAVQERLSAYWAAQDKVLAASRAAQAALVAPSAPADEGAWPAAVSVVAPAAAPGEALPAAAGRMDPGPAQRARALLAGESQAAWQALGNALDDWLAHQARRVAAVAQQSRLQSQWLRWATSGLLMAVLAVGLVAVLVRLRLPPGQGQATASEQASAAASGLPETLDRIAMHSRLVALNAAVQAARQGEPSVSDLAERSHLAAEAEALARRCDAARRGLRLAPPRVQSSVEPSGFQPSR